MGAEENYLQRAQRCNIILLKEIDRVCRKYNLKYYMICGTLLGAVRHKGLIPWDDDIDIAMTRDDFDELKRIAAREWENSDFLFADYDNLGKGTYLDYMSRLVYLKESVPINTFKKIKGKGRQDIDNHIPLDIYVLDNASDDTAEHEKQILIFKILYGLGMGHRAYVDFSEYEDQPAEMQKKIRILVKVGKLVPLKIITAVYEKVRKKYNAQQTKDYIMSNGFIFCLGWRFPKEWFGEGVRLDVEGNYFMAPLKYHEYLTSFYGDYMKLPPEEKRHPTHSIEASGIHHV